MYPQSNFPRDTSKSKSVNETNGLSLTNCAKWSPLEELTFTDRHWPYMQTFCTLV